MRSLTSRFLWLVVLTPILAISGFSLFYVARHLGVPAWIAVGLSTCYDGAALKCADYSLKYAQERMPSAVPRIAVWAFALTGAYLQTLHARLGNEPAQSWLLWASLPVIAVVVYEVHIRYERRKALAKAGVAYPAPLPSFGFVSWVLFPYKTTTSLRGIVENRSAAIVTHAKQAAIFPPKPTKTVAIEAEHDDSPTLTLVAGSTNARHANARHANAKQVRAWAKANGYDIGDRARIPGKVWEDYEAAHRPKPEQEASDERAAPDS